MHVITDLEVGDLVLEIDVLPIFTLGRFFPFAEFLSDTFHLLFQLLDLFLFAPKISLDALELEPHRLDLLVALPALGFLFRRQLLDLFLQLSLAFLQGLDSLFELGDGLLVIARLSLGFGDLVFKLGQGSLQLRQLGLRTRVAC